jgi:hypothetical protein
MINLKMNEDYGNIKRIAEELKEDIDRLEGLAWEIIANEDYCK